MPATSANLGSGFDVLGLALALYNEFRVSLAPSTSIAGKGQIEGLPLDETNLFYKSLAYLFGVEGRRPPALRVEMELNIPHGRGLGSSATAVVGGLVAANALLGGPFGNAALLQEAVKLEQGRHADNVAPALLGGLVICAPDDMGVIPVQVPFPGDLRAVLFTPDLGMDTVKGRALMPSEYPTADVVFSTSRVALFMAALARGDYSLLRTAMQDRLHQPYRALLFPLFPAIIEAALEAGAHGACLSGGGSSVLALASNSFEAIAAAMQETAQKARTHGIAHVLDTDRTGATVRQERPQT